MLHGRPSCRGALVRTSCLAITHYEHCVMPALSDFTMDAELRIYISDY